MTKHIRNILNNSELDFKQVCAKFAHTATDGKTYQSQFYNIDLEPAKEYLSLMKDDKSESVRNIVAER